MCCCISQMQWFHTLVSRTSWMYNNVAANRISRLSVRINENNDMKEAQKKIQNLTLLRDANASLHLDYEVASKQSLSMRVLDFRNKPLPNEVLIENVILKGL